MNRTDILDTAKACVTRDRQQTYGSAENNFTRVAAYWSTHLGSPVTAIDVAVMLGLLKVARIHSSPTHADNWVDLAGYAACGGEIASARAEDEEKKSPPMARPQDAIVYVETRDINRDIARWFADQEQHDANEQLEADCEEIALRVLSTGNLDDAKAVIRAYLTGEWDDEEDFGEVLGNPEHWEDETPEVYAVEEAKDAGFAVGIDAGESAGTGDDRYVVVQIEPEITFSELESRIRGFLAQDRTRSLAQFSSFCAHIGSHRVASYSPNNRTRLAFYIGCATEGLDASTAVMDDALRMAGFEFGAA
ncbi:hypothetical protein vB_RpoS-V16_80 [Ruegeria phage vB_RpoS-V16]|uniref:phosphofructokinase n=1 Tax=Ruegeria phage vB_RpoS-V16 TaxID=2218618 RepID=UPI000DCAB1BD|nr:phosphofructokinase [Ruegeria phage vB_RpoS-V16]AWY09516.1 hypothetical protein vB_RpoS-V16_80 [Ruegeria phage vB_RpoS-V16]